MADVTTHDHAETWDLADVQALTVYVNRGLSYDAIADLMGRTIGAVRSKLYRLRRAG